MKLNYYIIILSLLIFGCSYTSKTLFNVKGNNVKSVYVTGNNAEILINREMNIKLF